MADKDFPKAEDERIITPKEEEEEKEADHEPIKPPSTDPIVEETAKEVTKDVVMEEVVNKEEEMREKAIQEAKRKAKGKAPMLEEEEEDKAKMLEKAIQEAKRKLKGKAPMVEEEEDMIIIDVEHEANKENNNSESKDILWPPDMIDNILKESKKIDGTLDIFVDSLKQNSPADTSPVVSDDESYAGHDILDSSELSDVADDFYDLVRKGKDLRRKRLLDDIDKHALSSHQDPDEDPMKLIHVPTDLIECFMDLAGPNTQNDVETCGLLAGRLESDGHYYVRTLIIPDQEATATSCQTKNEQDVFEYQDRVSEITLGWIHTHPTQTCFLSSIDLHTQYGYQVSLPEAFAIVMAPKDTTRQQGIFRLTNPGGMSIIQQCHQGNFHEHKPASNGQPVYHHCSNICLEASQEYITVDLRG